MNKQLRPGLHITLSYTLLIVVIVMLFSYLIAPAWHKRTEYKEAIANIQSQNTRFAAGIREYRTALEQTSDTNQEALSRQDNARLLTASTPALAGAQLQELLRGLIAPLEAELTSATVIRGDSSGIFPAVSVNLRLRCSIAALREILFAIESHELALFITSLHVQSRHRAGREIRQLGDELEVRMDITGYLNTATGD